ncbi:hypothetical protein K2Z84_26125 [Candidatus Binatia bacterium]|nr:hypothetical protein [Candidatus Binatia bacterium]
MTRSARGRFAFAVAAIALLAARVLPAAADSFVAFETGQVRPLAMSPDGSRLFALNTPDNRLEIFTIGAGGALTHDGSVVVGLEPIALAARSDAEVWVVNHLSDSISVVDVSSSPPRVIRTITTCDEPRDIVFAGPGGNRAFVTTARRGQNCPVTFDPTTPGIGRALVQVWDASALGSGLQASPIANLILFADTPRALARSADGNTVYAAAFHSGNQTTSILEGLVCDGGAGAPSCVPTSGANAPGGLPAPNVDSNGVPGPETGLIVKFDNGTNQWLDTLGRDWTSVVRFSLPDRDVFAIDAAAALPVETTSFQHVGTILFDMVQNPVNGKIYVTNTEARNEVRFEGPGLNGATTVQGHLHEARVTVLDGGNVLPRHLNKHIDYDVRPAPPGTAANSLATPTAMAVTADGATLYVAAFGSSKIGVFQTSEIENDTFTPSASSHITLSGGGPTGLVLDEARSRLYVLTRFDDSIAVIDTDTASEIAQVALFNPEPETIRDGRPMLYDAAFTSSNGETSCSSCHVFGDLDSLAWDLGDPSGTVLNNPLPFRIAALGIPKDFHPLKGPMTTQSLRGMANHGSLHWRGDRTAGNDAVNPDSFDEVRAFEKFNPAFTGLIGRTSELSATDMRAFADFMLSVTYPPNPVRALDNSLSSAEQEGRDLFFGPLTDVLFNCNGCHHLDPSVNASLDGTFSPNTGFFGSDGFGTFEGESQMFKVAHLRNTYTKVGMFGLAPGANTGNQVRGFGVLHDGAVDTIFNFLSASVFSLTNTQQRRAQSFVLAMDSNLKPIVGQQATLSATQNGTNPNNRVTLLETRSAAGDCDLVIRANLNGEARGGLRLADGTFQLDREDEPTISDPDLRAAALLAGQEVTFTCVPRGSGTRIGLDRDEDGFYDRDELDAGTDPADPSSHAIVPSLIRTASLSLRDDPSPPVNPNVSRLSFRSAKYGVAPSGVVIPAPGSAADPTSAGANGGGAILTVYRTDGGTDKVVLPLAASRWKKTGTASKPGFSYSDTGHAGGPITSVALRNGTLTIRGNGAGIYQLDNAPQGGLALRLELGGTVQLCAAVAPKDASNDTTSKFVGVRNSNAPAECPPVP